MSDHSDEYKYHEEAEETQSHEEERSEDAPQVDQTNLEEEGQGEEIPQQEEEEELDFHEEKDGSDAEEEEPRSDTRRPGDVAEDEHVDVYASRDSSDVPPAEAAHDAPPQNMNVYHAPSVPDNYYTHREDTVSRRRSSVANQQSVRRASSVVSGIRTGDGRNIIKENHDSLVPDPQLQELRRQSILSASRYRSARRASSLTNSMGLPETPTGSPCRSSRGGSVGRQRMAMTEAEAHALEVIAANDEHRMEIYHRAREIDTEKECYVIDQEIQKHSKAEENYVKLLNDRQSKMKQQFMDRQKRMEEAERRRTEQEAERRRLLEEKISQRERDTPRDAYNGMLVRRRYSSPVVPRRASNTQPVAPQRRPSSSQQQQQQQGAGSRRASGANSQSRTGSADVKRHGWR